MSHFSVQGGQFKLDGKPVLLHAAEFHYFRTPADQWRHRLDLMAEAGFNTLAAYIPWIWHQLAEDLSDFDGHSHPMRNLEGFLDLAAEMGFWIMARPGPYIMAETINEGIPPWVFHHYPQCAFISQDQKVQNIASYLHPDFLACCKKWYQAIFQVLTPRQVTHGGKILLVQLDNEMGMMPWVRNIFDTNPDTLARFSDYLHQAYGEDLTAHYPAHNLVETLREGLINPTWPGSAIPSTAPSAAPGSAPSGAPSAAPLGAPYAAPSGALIAEDYRRFYRAYLREYASFLWDEAAKNGMDVPPVVNIHGFANGGKTFPIGISQLVEVMRLPGMISATDVYPGIIGEGSFHELLMVNELTKAVQNPEQPLFSIEFQSGGSPDFSNTQTSFFDLHTRLCLSTGMRAINHYLFFGGENDPILSPVRRHDWGPPVRPDGSTRKHYDRYGQLSQALHAYGQALVESQPHTAATLGLILDYFMTEVHNPVEREAVSILTHQREIVGFDMIGRGLALTHRPFDALDLTSAPLDPQHTPLLWVMMEEQCDAPVQQKLVDYLQAGGKLIMAGRVCIEDFHHNLCTILIDALGIEGIVEDPPFIVEELEAFGYEHVPVSFIETYTGPFDAIIATRGAGETVGFIKNVGRGQALVFGAAMYTHALGDIDIVNQMALRMGCPPLFKLSEWADVRLSRGQDGSFLFINNYKDDPIETTIEYQGRPLFGGHPVCLPARRGAILPLEWKLNQDITIHYLTSELRQVQDEGKRIILKTAGADFVAELSLQNYACKQGDPVSGTERVRVQGTNGMIVLERTER